MAVTSGSEIVARVDTVADDASPDDDWELPGRIFAGGDRSGLAARDGRPHGGAEGMCLLEQRTREWCVYSRQENKLYRKLFRLHEIY